MSPAELSKGVSSDTLASDSQTTVAATPVPERAQKKCKGVPLAAKSCVKLEPPGVGVIPIPKAAILTPPPKKASNPDVPVGPDVSLGGGPTRAKPIVSPAPPAKPKACAPASMKAEYGEPPESQLSLHSFVAYDRFSTF